MAIALGVIKAMKSDKRAVLLYGEAWLASQVFRTDKEIPAGFHPKGSARAVNQRLVDALARFCGYTAISEGSGARKCVVAVVRFVDDECRLSCERPEIEFPGVFTRERLLDVKQPQRKWRNRFVGIKRLHQGAEISNALILLVGVEGCLVAAVS